MAEPGASRREEVHAVAYQPNTRGTRSRSRAWRVAADTVVVLIVIALTIPFLPLDSVGLSALTVAFGVAAAVTVALRRRSPRIVNAVAVGLVLAAMTFQAPVAATLVAAVVTVYEVALRSRRAVAAATAAATFVVISAGAVLLLPPVWWEFDIVLRAAAAVALAAAFGDAQRARRAYIVAITERAQRAEETREAEAQRRVAEERLRIARDLHDVMAHQIAVISLNAQVATKSLPDKPAQAGAALAVIGDAARTVLRDTAGLMRVLRSDADGTGSATTPAPGLGAVQELVDTFARNGLAVDLRVRGDLRGLPAEIDLAGYRLAQEALTNAHKHGTDDGALLQIDRRADSLEVTVVNVVDPTPPTTRPDGHGLLGARERAAAAGGELRAGFGPGPVYRFEAQLPLDAKASDRATGSAPERGVDW